MFKKIIKKVEYTIKTSKIYNMGAYLEGIRTKGEQPVRESRYHLIEAVKWLKRAQDATPDGGVARGYSMAWNPFFQKKGWQPSYPETTGYIIPTFFDCAKYFNDPELSQRAMRMAEWEIDVQMKNGAVRGGVVGDGEDIPAVFCTGQVILGWARAYKETNEISFLNAAEKAGDFLIEVQNAKGEFIEDRNYKYANSSTTVYHTRVAWSLIVLGKTTNKKKYIQSGIKNIEFNLRCQEKNGWFRDNCLSDPDQPLLHTIAYSIRGILEAGVILNNQTYVSSAKMTADALIEKQRVDGSLAGRFDKNWMPKAHWSCLTGDAQLSIIWGRLFIITGESKYYNSMKKINRYLMKCQIIQTGNKDLLGGISGSYPIQGSYGKFEILNWATKFYMDALLLEDLIREDKESLRPLKNSSDF